MNAQAISQAQRERVKELLGREPRGLRAIPVTGPDGEPRVIRVASIVEGKPFPTLFWLVDPDLNYRIDRLEASGLIGELQARVDADPALQAAMAADHEAHIALRYACMEEDERGAALASGFSATFARRGIGGIEKPTRIRCLHTWYAAHLVAPNCIGALVEKYLANPGGAAPTATPGDRGPA